jgi:hypothetical protein
MGSQGADKQKSGQRENEHMSKYVVEMKRPVLPIAILPQRHRSEQQHNPVMTVMREKQGRRRGKIQLEIVCMCVING